MITLEWIGYRDVMVGKNIILRIYTLGAIMASSVILFLKMHHNSYVDYFIREMEKQVLTFMAATRRMPFHFGLFAFS